jgi:hypothetical protein
MKGEGGEIPAEPIDLMIPDIWSFSGLQNPGTDRLSGCNLLSGNVWNQNNYRLNMPWLPLIYRIKGHIKTGE